MQRLLHEEYEGIERLLLGRGTRPALHRHPAEESRDLVTSRRIGERGAMNRANRTAHSR